MEKASGDKYFKAYFKENSGLQNIRDSSIFKSLINYNKNINIDDLIFITLDYGKAIFTYNNNFMFYDVEESIWGTNLHEVLNTTTNSNSIYAKLMENSSTNIEYILYPFENDTDLIIAIRAENLTDMAGAIEIQDDEIDETRVYVLENGYKLYIDEGSYIIKKDDHFVSGFIDDNCNFQLGDCMTQAYILNNGNIIVYNCGDVPSAVIIRFI